MGVVAYSFMAYGLMAVISLAVIGIIVLINKILSRDNQEAGEENNE